jgi:hypothetical protein
LYRANGSFGELLHTMWRYYQRNGEIDIFTINRLNTNMALLQEQKVVQTEILLVKYLY